MLAELSPKMLEQEIQDLCAKAGDLAAREAIGQSVEGRDITAVTITDPGADASMKQRVWLQAAQHGAEQSMLLLQASPQWPGVIGPVGAFTCLRRRNVCSHVFGPPMCYFK